MQISDEIQKLKYKEPTSTKIVTLEQELVRAEAQSLVAEAQLTNITRQKFKEAYDLQTAAIIERAEKQILLAKQARRLVNLLDDTPIVPGDAHPVYEETEYAKEILNDAEIELRQWQPNVEPIHSSASGLGSNAMPAQEQHVPTSQHTQHSEHDTASSIVPMSSNVSTMGATENAPPVPAHMTEGAVTSDLTNMTSSYTESQPRYTSSETTYTTQQPYPTGEPTYTTSNY